MNSAGPAARSARVSVGRLRVPPAMDAAVPAAQEAPPQAATTAASSSAAASAKKAEGGAGWEVATDKSSLSIQLQKSQPDVVLSLQSRCVGPGRVEGFAAGCSHHSCCPLELRDCSGLASHVGPRPWDTPLIDALTLELLQTHPQLRPSHPRRLHPRRPPSPWGRHATSPWPYQHVGTQTEHREGHQAPKTRRVSAATQTSEVMDKPCCCLHPGMWLPPFPSSGATSVSHSSGLDRIDGAEGAACGARSRLPPGTATPSSPSDASDASPDIDTSGKAQIMPHSFNHRRSIRLSRSSTASSITSVGKTADEDGRVLDLLRDELPEPLLAEEEHRRNLQLLEDASRASQRFLARPGRRSRHSLSEAASSPGLSPRSTPFPLPSCGTSQAGTPPALSPPLPARVAPLRAPTACLDSAASAAGASAEGGIKKGPKPLVETGGDKEGNVPHATANVEPSLAADKSPGPGPSAQPRCPGEDAAPQTAARVGGGAGQGPADGGPDGGPGSTAAGRARESAAQGAKQLTADPPTPGNLKPSSSPRQHKPLLKSNSVTFKFPESSVSSSNGDSQATNGLNDGPLLSIKQHKLIKLREGKKQTWCRTVGDQKMPELAEAAERKSDTEDDNEGEVVAASTDAQKPPAKPVVSDKLLHSLQLHRSQASRPSLSEQEVETAFVRLSLAFRNDMFSLEKRLRLEERARNLAEENVSCEIDAVSSTVQMFAPLCQDSQTRDTYQQLQQNLQVLRKATMRASSCSEKLGAVNQEGRLCRAMEVMVQHVENLKRLYAREHAELEDVRKLLQHNSRSVHSGSGDSSDEGMARGNRSMSIIGSLGKPTARRRVSVSVIPKFFNFPSGGGNQLASPILEARINEVKKQEASIIAPEKIIPAFLAPKETSQPSGHMLMGLTRAALKESPPLIPQGAQGVKIVGARPLNPLAQDNVEEETLVSS
ncbi:inositol 1,4,5-triphosphate receptor associated 1-like isoform X2 [Lethenteron reissneri]|uniref:inositol 1,4,5-triphosphate receptor associated 1-like isoform X2 n=1 Tax=Lethenteron reissneri TaxID=7753 RepID=UPI002AB6EAE6|nr:inositol 1,4,5-triphosphate receptor associated 1-like isoform X2 [Lethenteron reissneri]